MPRLLWLAPALVALGLLASLIPQITYPSASSGEPRGDVLIAWPGWAIQQDLGPLDGTVGPFHVWVSAELDRGVATVWASLVDASTTEVLRQTTIEATPAYVPVERTLSFPSYVVRDGQRIRLQLQVATFEERHVIFGLSKPHLAYANVAVNGVPNSGVGPLAFEHLQTGSGMRAGIAGDPYARIQLILAVALSVLAVAVHPMVAGLLRDMGGTVWAFLGRPIDAVRRMSGHDSNEEFPGTPTTFGSIIRAPLYPWLMPAIPILHFIATNPVHFSINEAVIPIGVVLMAVSAGMVGLRLLLNDWYRPAATISTVVVLFFAFGHIERALDYRIDERVLLAVTLVVGVSAVARTVRRPPPISAGWTKFLNLASAILLVVNIAGLVAAAATSLGRNPPNNSESLEYLASHLLPDGIPPVSTSRKPDIYYIILDSYARNDALDGFDNTQFLNELRSRGFYVADSAISNYPSSIRSIPSSLNLSYLEDLDYRGDLSDKDLVDIANRSALAAILKTLGYKYIHFRSGTHVSDNSPLADVTLTFTPNGVLVGAASDDSRGQIVSRRFWRALIETTLLRPMVGEYFLVSDTTPYSWWSPRRTLQMFEVLSAESDSGSPKFVFAHIMKPHRPATFDRHGNYLSGNRVHEVGSRTVALSDEFSDSHDPSVPNAYVGQLIYVNSLVLNAIDAIIRSSDSPPIIVLSADHGPAGKTPRHEILAAFHLPYGGNQGLYPSISSVNHFRYILDYYFRLGIGLTEDKIVSR